MVEVIILIMTNSKWIPIIYTPQQPGHYLVCHEGIEHKKYRFVKYWTGEEWYHAYEDKYGPITYWMTLPELP